MNDMSETRDDETDGPTLMVIEPANVDRDRLIAAMLLAGVTKAALVNRDGSFTWLL